MRYFAFYAPNLVPNTGDTSLISCLRKGDHDLYVKSLITGFSQKIIINKRKETAGRGLRMTVLWIISTPNVRVVVCVRFSCATALHTPVNLHSLCTPTTPIRCICPL